jgi:hypothetical protein
MCTRGGKLMRGGGVGETTHEKKIVAPDGETQKTYAIFGTPATRGIPSPHVSAHSTSTRAINLLRPRGGRKGVRQQVGDGVVGGRLLEAAYRLPYRLQPQYMRGNQTSLTLSIKVIVTRKRTIC